MKRKLKHPPGSKECLNCKRKVSGRSDKRFCDHVCRNEYHNSAAREKKQKAKSLIQ